MILSFTLQDVGSDIRTRTANVLGHSVLGAFYLSGTSRSAKLLRDLKELIDPGSSNWMPPGFKPTHGGNRYLRIEFDLALQSQLRTATRLGETASFKR